MALDTFPQHAAIPYYEVQDDQIVVGGKKLTALAEEVGRTPFFVYDRRVVAAKAAMLRDALPKRLRLHYAVKANPMPALAAYVAPLVDGMDVASARELEVALEAGMPADRVSFAGPGKQDFELEAALEAGITVNVESENELIRLERLAHESGRRARIAIRVNPDFELKASGMKMAGGAKQFGIDAERVPGVLAGLDGSNSEFVGFHIFSGSQNLRAESLIEAQTKTIELAARLAASAPGPVKKLNIGGGFGIPYSPADMPLDLEPIGRNLENLLDEAERAMPGVVCVLELGRYLVGEAGLYVCRVVDRKISRGQVFLVTDGGLHHHLAASGNFGQVVRRNYPVLVGNHVQGETREVVSVVGPLCTPLDLLADRMEMAQADVGDLIVVCQSGAYGYTASPLQFLSHRAPVECLA